MKKKSVFRRFFLLVVLCSLNSFWAMAQNKIISGTVFDDTGETLPGVTVVVKGNTGGTVTGANGKYSIGVSPSAKTLVFKYMGMIAEEISIGNRSTIDLQMKKADVGIDEVTVVAYGTQKKESVIGSITTIRPAELKVPSSNLTTALAGRVAGLIAYQRSGEPGADNAEFFINGATTFGYKKSPLILIDGMEMTTNDLARLQTDDIESFTIMKDATANALYGARGANGVILINTKTGKVGTAKVFVRLENSTSSNTKNVQLADPVTYMKLSNESVLTRNPLGVLLYSQSKIDNTISGVNPIMYPAVDWMKELIEPTATNSRVNLNLQGGDKIVTYYIAAGYAKDNGNLKVDKRNNFNSNINLVNTNLRANVDINVTKTTKAMVRLYGQFKDYTGPMDGGSGMYQKVMKTNPVYFRPYYEPDLEHQYTSHIMFGNTLTSTGSTLLNPYADMIKGYKQSSESLMLAQFELRQDLSFITKGLNLRGMFNTNRTASFDVTRQYKPFYYAPGSYDKLTNTFKLYPLNPTGGDDYLSYDRGQPKVAMTVYGETALNYSRTINDKHALSGMLVGTIRNGLNSTGTDLQASLPSRNIGLAGRGTYAYDNKYFAEFNFGYYGSERFYKTERYGFFPTAGLAWYISNEAFWQPLLSVVSKLKIRGNYGLVGNDEIGSSSERFFYLSNVNMSDGGYGASFGTDGGYSLNGISISRYSNPNITWETAVNSTFGLEVSLFKRFNIIAEYFTEHRYNILMERASIPKTMGLQGSTPKANVGEANSKTYDLSVDYAGNYGKYFSMDVRANITYARNKYAAFEEPNYVEPWSYRVGYSTSQKWGYIAERLFVDDEEVRSSPTQKFGSTTTMGGDIKYRDVNGDQVIDSKDMVPIGYPTSPEINYGFGISSNYKNITFSFFLQGSARSSFWIDYASTSPFVGQNQLLKAYADNHWSEDNRNLYALWPRLSSVINENNNQSSTWFMRNGSFLRLKEVEVGYTIPRKIGQRLKLDRLRVYAGGTNLANLCGFKLWDIEMGGDGLKYPIQKVVNLGIEIGF